jgi:hypothetical protein
MWIREDLGTRVAVAVTVLTVMAWGLLVAL